MKLGVRTQKVATGSENILKVTPLQDLVANLDSRMVTGKFLAIVQALAKCSIIFVCRQIVSKSRH